MANWLFRKARNRLIFCLPAAAASVAAAAVVILNLILLFMLR